MSEIKAVYLKCNLPIVSAFSAGSVLFPHQYHLIEHDDGSVDCHPLPSSTKREVHHIPAHNVACITYSIMPTVDIIEDQLTVPQEQVHMVAMEVAKKPLHKGGRPKKVK